MSAEANKKLLDLGLLILRVGIGICFIKHGLPKLLGGKMLWGTIGSAMGFIGIKFGYTFWGLMASLSEFLGGIFLILGIFVNAASAFMFFTMVIATIMQIGMKHDFNLVSHPMELSIVFLSLALMGGGSYKLKLPCGCKK